MNPPRVFISYSHDSADHKKWVLDFATTLRNRGIDAVLDQWDLKPGDDLPHFMEQQLASADYILMICSETYVEKANAGTGGVGYEKMIITSSLLSKIDSNKVIPIIKQLGTNTRPTFLNTKLYINFSNSKDYEYSFDDLIRVILNAPLYEKPKIGNNPFKPMENARPDRTSDGIKEVMKGVAKCYDGNSENFIMFSILVKLVSMHRLTLDRYLQQAAEEGYIVWRNDYSLYITDAGTDYLIAHEIIK